MRRYQIETEPALKWHVASPLTRSFSHASPFPVLLSRRFPPIFPSSVGYKEAPPFHRFSPCSHLVVDNTINAASPTNMPRRLATSWATLTQALLRRFLTEVQNPPSTNDKHIEEGEDSDIEWPKEGEDDPMAEPEQMQGAEQVPEPEQPMWPEQNAAYNSFITAREESRLRYFRSFAMAMKKAAEARAIELSRQTALEEAHEEVHSLRSFVMAATERERHA